MSTPTLVNHCSYDRCTHPTHDEYGLCEKHAERRRKILVEKLRFRIPCVDCGEETATVERGICARCVALAPCIKCGAPRQKTATTGMCGGCYAAQFPPRRTKCTFCGSGLGRENKTGKCRSCANRMRFRKVSCHA